MLLLLLLVGCAEEEEEEEEEEEDDDDDDDDRNEGERREGGIGETDSDRLPSPSATDLSGARVRAPTASVLIVGPSEEAAVTVASVEGVMSAFQATAAEIALAYEYAHTKCDALLEGEEWVLSPEDVLRTIYALIFHDFTVTVGRVGASAPVGIGSWIRSERDTYAGGERFDAVSAMMQGEKPDNDDSPKLSEQARSLFQGDDYGVVPSNYVFAVYKYVYGDMSFADLKAFFAGHLRRDWGVDAVEQRLRIAVSLKRILGYAGSLRGGQDACDAFRAMAGAFKAVGTEAVPAKRDAVVEVGMRQAYANLCKTVGEVTISYTTDSTMGSNFARRYYPSNPHSLLYRELQNILAVKTSGDAGIFGDAWTAFMQFALAGRWYAHDRYAMVCLGAGGATTLPAALLAQNFRTFQICAQSVLAGFGQKRIDEYYLWNPSVYLLPVMASKATDSALREGRGLNLPLNYGSWFTCVQRESTRVLELAGGVPETAKGHAILQIAVGDARRLMASMDRILGTPLPQLENKTVGQVISLLHKFYSTFQHHHDIGDPSSMHHFVSGICGLVFSKEFRAQLARVRPPNNEVLEAYAHQLLDNVDLAGGLAAIAPAMHFTRPGGVAEYLGICGGVDMVTARVFPHLQYLVNVTKKLIESCLRVVRVTQDLTPAQMSGRVRPGGQDAAASRVSGGTKQELPSEVLLNYSTATACRFPGQALAACTAATVAATFVHAHNLQCVPASFWTAADSGSSHADLLPPSNLLPPGGLLPPGDPPGSTLPSGKKSRQAAAASETPEDPSAAAAAQAAAAASETTADPSAAAAQAAAASPPPPLCGEFNHILNPDDGLEVAIAKLRNWAKGVRERGSLYPPVFIDTNTSVKQENGVTEARAHNTLGGAVYWWTDIDILYALRALGNGLNIQDNTHIQPEHFKVTSAASDRSATITYVRAPPHWVVSINATGTRAEQLVQESQNAQILDGLHKTGGDCGPSAVVIALFWVCNGREPKPTGGGSGFGGGRRTLKTPLIRSNRTRRREKKRKRNRTVRSNKN